MKKRTPGPRSDPIAKAWEGNTLCHRCGFQKKIESMPRRTKKKPPHNMEKTLNPRNGLPHRPFPHGNTERTHMHAFSLPKAYPPYTRKKTSSRNPKFKNSKSFREAEKSFLFALFPPRDRISWNWATHLPTWRERTEPTPQSANPQRIYATTMAHPQANPSPKTR